MKTATVTTLVLCIGVLLSQASGADETTEQLSGSDLKTELADDLNRFTLPALEKICKGDPQGCNDLRPYTVRRLQQNDRFDAFQKQCAAKFGQLQAAYGEPLGVEYIREEIATESLCRRFYLVKYEDGIVVWRVTYYRPHNQWLIFDLHFNVDIKLAFAD